MSQEDRDEWLEAIYDLHRHSLWFSDTRGAVFSFLWYDSMRDGV